MIDIDEAVKTRWTARSLSSTITGGIHHARAPEQTSMPYCIYSNVSDAPTSGTRSSRYNRALIQFDVYDTTPYLVGSHSKLIRAAFVNSDKAAANALAMTEGGTIKRIEPDGNPVVLQEADEVYRGTQTLAVEWAESRNLVPTA